jgi:hypothetical protein
LIARVRPVLDDGTVRVTREELVILVMLYDTLVIRVIYVRQDDCFEHCAQCSQDSRPGP